MPNSMPAWDGAMLLAAVLGVVMLIELKESITTLMLVYIAMALPPSFILPWRCRRQELLDQFQLHLFP